MAECTSGRNLTVLVLDEFEAKALARGIARVVDLFEAQRTAGTVDGRDSVASVVLSDIYDALEG